MTDGLQKRMLRTAGIVLAAMTAGVLILTVIGGFLEFCAEIDYLVAPTALLGLLSPVAGYRIYLRMRERLPEDAGDEFRCHRFLAATITAAAITESIAIVGVIAFMLSGKFAGLIGVVTHVILVGAIWPSPERLEAFLVAERNSP